MELNVYKYSNYRNFLKDFYKLSKRTKKNFSLRYFSKRAGFSCPNMLQLIMNGKRNLTKESIPVFAKLIGLSVNEQRFFEALVSLNQAKSIETRRYYMELVHVLGEHKEDITISEDQFEFLSKWYYPAISELVILPGFREDPYWIKRQLNCRITADQARDAISALIRLGIIKRDEEGKLVQAEANIATNKEINDVAAYKFHLQMLDIARESIINDHSDDRDISGVTMAVSDEQFKEIKKRVREFEYNIMRYLSNNPTTPDSVCQLNIQLFPLTKKSRGQ